jgi:competence CoiA-like predicted nuclease
MIYAWVDGVKRQPKAKGETSVCTGCGGKLFAVISPTRIAHWRHKGGDCDSWSEAEGPWHQQWKSIFPVEWCEVTLKNQAGDTHRADVLVPTSEGAPLVLELQHSFIPIEEMLIREKFYKEDHRMFWLVHLYQDNKCNSSFNFEMSLNTPLATHEVKGKKFEVHEWIMRGNFLDKWKSSTAHVFLDVRGKIFYLATLAACKDLASSLKPKEFAIARLTRQDFFKAAGAVVNA